MKFNFGTQPTNEQTATSTTYTQAHISWKARLRNAFERKEKNNNNDDDDDEEEKQQQQPQKIVRSPREKERGYDIKI